MAPLGVMILAALAITLFILVVIFVMVPVFKGLGYLIGWLFTAIGWLLSHLIEFVGGMIGDTLRFIGSIVAMVVFVPLVVLQVVLGRWSAAGHFASSVRREFRVAGTSVYRVLLRRPLKLFWLHGILEGVEQRLPEAMAAAPMADKPHRKRVGQFDGYTIVGSLAGGGSGAKLYVAKPVPPKRGVPDRVVIKTFALTDGSSLPQIVRESRALEAAKQLGLVIEHGMDDHRFFYVMPYHAGDHLGIVTRQLHGQSGTRGLDDKHLNAVIRYTGDLLNTLSTYHRGGLWHKDIKPENVIINDGRARIVDLGLVTPLRSAMTLTTHGTEYFRDPELVRQALRGVKVHEVDGARFDLYAVGAVLYFVLENTFPAHGALSKFNKKSPEALRWIVRRAMTDYDKRYESADAMLADLEVILHASDPYAVKPAQLPSMGGSRGESYAYDVPPPIPQTHNDERSDADGVEVASVRAGTPANVNSGNDADAHRAGRRPRLRITDWWTGAYGVDDAGNEPVDMPMAAHVAKMDAPGTTHDAARQQAQGFQRDADAIASQFRAGAISARKAAREQIKAARRRANEMRKRAHGHRANACRKTKNPADSRPSGFVAFIVLAVLVGGGVLGYTWIEQGQHDYDWSQRAKTSATFASHQPGVLLVVSADDPHDPTFSFELNTIAQRWNNTYQVVLPSAETNAYYRGLHAAWKMDRPHADAMLEDALEDDGLYGLIFVDTQNDMRDGLIYSERNGAADRTLATSPAMAATAGPVLVINDHPLMYQQDIKEQINAQLDSYRENGWELLFADELEIAVRNLLPPALSEAGPQMPERLTHLLAQHSLGGVMIITGSSPDTCTEYDVEVQILRHESTAPPFVLLDH